MQVPKSLHEKVGGMVHFARMLDKLRLFEQGQLRADFHANLGRGADGWCCGFLRVAYADLKARALAGGTDEEILQWCFEHGRRLDETDILVWNGFATKLGWRDFASGRLEKLKAQHGLADRADIQSMPDFFEVDEGRKP